MTVFLRWGVFALLATAALIYAYRVNERSGDIAARLDAQRANATLPSTANPSPENADATSGKATPKARIAPLDAACRPVLRAVQLGVEGAARGEPLDRVLRHSDIAFEADERQQRQLAAAATRAYQAPPLTTAERESLAREICANAVSPPDMPANNSLQN
jgi:hypothetical protein